jgi:hypothetical protein
VEIERWKVDRIDADAAIAIRRHLKALEAYRSAVEVLASLPDPSPASLAERLTEGFRLDELWTRLKPLMKQGELPTNADPLELLDRTRARLEALLKSPSLPAPTPGVPLVAVVPVPPPAPPPPPDAAVRAALAALGNLLDSEAPAGDSPLSGVRETFSPVQPLVEVVHLLLLRGARDWGLLSDRFVAKAGERKVDLECTLETVSPQYVSARLSSGERLSGLRAPDGRWTVRLPHGEPFAAESCEGRRNLPAAAGETLRRHLERLAPGEWAAATAEQHLDEARRLETEVPAALQASGPRAADFLRILAAAHAGAALDKDPADGGAAARARLAVMGWGITTANFWQRPGEAGAADAGALLREGKADLALLALKDPPAGGGFPGALRLAVIRLRRPIPTAVELAEIQRQLQRLAAEARTEVERRHAEALLDSLGKDSRCVRCGGDPISTCTACRGRGQKTVFCGRCNGQGVLLRVGTGAGTGSSGPTRCPQCSGRPGPTSESCRPCGGTGKVSCRDCPPQRPPPAPDQVATMTACPSCIGRGRTNGRVAFACTTCAGLGVLLVPTADPQAVLR